MLIDANHVKIAQKIQIDLNLIVMFDKQRAFERSISVIFKIGKVRQG